VNELAGALSPYLQQHAANPVAWRQWSPAALADAAHRDVPLLISIGYSTCRRWSRLSLRIRIYPDPQFILIRTMRIRQRSGSELFDELKRFLESTLPHNWHLETHPLSGYESDHGYDAVIAVEAPDDTRVSLLVQLKPTLSPSQVPKLVNSLELGAHRFGSESVDSTAGMLLSNFISKRSRELLEAAGIGWFDPTGNIKIKADRPSLFIEQSGADRNPNSDTEGRRQKSLRGPGAARIVRSLLDGTTDTRVRALAVQAEVGAATSARVLGYLAQEHLVERDEHATVRRVYKRSLAHAWARDYGMTRTNHTTAVLAPRGLGWVMNRLAEQRLPHVLTGSAALRRHLPKATAAVAPLSLLAVYSDDTPALQRELELRSTDRGANVLLIEPFDQAVLQGAQNADGLCYTAASQTVVDLLTSPGRGPEEASQLMEALAEREEEWTL
jgi:hypothetical protein